MGQNIEEISLREIIEILLRGKKIIALITLIAVLISGVFSFFIIKPTYEVTSAIIIKDINGKDSNSTIGKLLNENDMSISTLISAFDNIITGPKILNEAKEISPEWENITTGTLDSIIDVSLVNDSSTVNVTTKANLPEDAVALNNIVTNRFQEFIEEQNYDLLDSKVKSVKTQLEVDISLLEEKIKKEEEELAKLDKVLVYKKSISNDPYLLDLAAEIGNTNVVSISNLTVENEEPNPAYIKVLDSLTSNKLALNSLESDYNELINAENQLEEISKNTGMKATVVREAIEPENPVSPNKMMNLAIAGILGLMIGVFYVFIMEYWRSTSKKEEITG